MLLRSLPAIQCAELAAQRASAGVRQTLSHRVSSLATVSATAALLGLFDCVLALTYGFGSVSGPPSPIRAMVAGCLGQALFPAILGLLVAVIAYCFYQSLNTQLADFDLEMRIATRGLATGLTAYLQQLRTSSPIQWPTLSQTRAVPVSPIEGPRLRLIPTSRHGVWQLFWPNTQSDAEASAVLDAASTITLIYGIISCVQQWARHQWFDGLIVLAFFEIARRISAKRSPWGLAAVLVYLLAVTMERFHLYGLSDGTRCLLLAPLPLIGGLKAALSLKARSASLRHHLLLAALLVYIARPAQLLSTGIETYVLYGDSMLPSISDGDSLLSKAPFHPPPHSLAENYSKSPSTMASA